MKKDTPKLGHVVQIDEARIQDHLGALVRGSVEETLNALLDAEADRLCNAARYERTQARKDTRAGHYERKLQTRAGEVKLKVPQLRRQTFETAIIERYRRREASVEEALIEMDLAGVSVRRVEDITEALWGTRVSPSTISELNKKVYKHIEAWRSRPIEGEHPYVYLDGIVLKRSWAGEVRNVSVLVAIGVGEDGFRQVLGIAEGHKEDKSGWSGFLEHLKARGLKGVRLIISDACMGLVEAAAESFPEAQWQRCTVHFYRNIFSVVPTKHGRMVSDMLKAIHAREDRKAALAKAEAVIEKLEAMRLKEAAAKVREGIEETRMFYRFPASHWRRIRTNNPLERIMREIRRRTRVVGTFPDGKSALMLAAAPAATHCRYAVGNETLPENEFAAGSRCSRDLRGINHDRRHRRTKVRKILDTMRPCRCARKGPSMHAGRGQKPRRAGLPGGHRRAAEFPGPARLFSAAQYHGSGVESHQEPPYS